MKMLLRMLGVCVCASLLAGLAPSGPALADDYNDANDGNWTTAGTWDLGSAYPDSGDTATVDSNTVTLDINLTGAAAPDQITLGGGTLNLPWEQNREISSPISVTAESYLAPAASWWAPTLTLSGQISGTGKLVKLNTANVAVSLDNPSFSGGWDIQGGAVLPMADGALGTGTVDVTGGQLQVRAHQTAAKKPAFVDVSGGSVWNNNCNIDGWNMKLNNGTLILRGNWTGGTIELRGDNVFTGSDGGGEITSQLTGDGNVTWQYGYQTQNLILNADNSGWSGNLLGKADAPAICLWHGKGLGTGQTTVEGGLYIGYLGATGMDANVIIDGGSITNGQKDGWGPESTAINAGSTITLVGEGALQCDGNKTLTIDGLLTGAGTALLTGGGYPHTGGVGTIQVNNDANNHAGGTRVSFTLPRNAGARSEAVVTVNGALSSGAVSVEAGRLVTDPVAGGGSLDDAVLTFASIVEARGGTIELKSTENDGKIHLCEGGALINTAGNTTITYGAAAGNIHVHEGAILDPSLPLPTAGEIESACAKAGQIYVGTSGLGAAEQYDVAGVVKGLATIDNYPTISGTVSEAAGNGIGLYAQATRRMTLSGAKLVSTGELDLNGGGGDRPYDVGYGYGNWTGFQIAGADNFTAGGSVTTVNMNAAGRLIVETAAALPAAVTLNVNSGGVLQLKDGAAVAGTANVNSGGLLLCTSATWATAPSTGNWVMNSGGAMLADSGDDLTAGANFTWNPGAQLVLAGRDWPGGVPQNIDLLVAWEQWNQGINITGDVVLNDNTRITHAADYGRFVMFNAASGDIKTTGSVGRVAAPTYDRYLNFPNKINMPGATLIIGDTNTFNAVRYDGFGRQEIPQDGRVILGNTENVMEKVWIQAGELFLYTHGGATAIMGKLGNATEVRVDAGAVLYFDDHAVGLSTTFCGEGTITVKLPDARTLGVQGNQDGGGNHIGTISPGLSAGILTVDGGLAFYRTDLGGGVYENAWVVMDVAKSSGDAGDAYDQIVMSTRGEFANGYGRASNADLKVALPLPSGELNPNTLATVDMDIALSPAGLTSQSFASVGLADGTDSHWAIDPDTAVTWDTGNNKVILHGSAITWNGFGGDSDLNGVVNYLDLGVLATNYDLTGLGWGDGDFNFDGKVDYMDLGILATNYDLTEGSGGANIPEPAALVVLALGTAGLIRRRRR